MFRQLLLILMVLPFAMQVSARAEEPCPLEQKFMPPDDDESLYGRDVATDGTVAIVGSTGNKFSPVAYTLRFDGVAWTDGESFPAIQGASAVAINGDIALIGVHGFNSAYVYRFDGLTWLEEQVLESSGGSFGDAVALRPDWAFVTDTEEDKLHAYFYDGQSWLGFQTLSGTNGSKFGNAVALDNDIIVVGARFDDGNGMDAGAAFVYQLDGASWLLVGTLYPSDGIASDQFGSSVAISGDTIVVGAELDDDIGTNSGSVYVFEYDGVGWSECVKLNPPFEGSLLFGSAVAIKW